MYVVYTIMEIKNQLKTIRDNIAKEADSMKSSLYGTKKPLLPKRKVAFKINPVDDKPHYINK